MKRPRLDVKILAYLHILLALFIQFAPAIHAGSPHHHDSSACNHRLASTHIDASDADKSPCQVCAHLLGIHAVPFSNELRSGDVLIVRFTSPIFQVRPESSLLQLPDSRGPPVTL